ncbi:hypothetical protein POV27_08525 [Aureisphaera galaxeae]|uniref:hypothetical protein n=1 Tax=Aureisphaera galaxeae TaxID=1538023 RepID=UPI0023506D95|nr:hypothetical protein [Aureisphaera galaxeae]MDC8004096.1 hypothetical protein [Aureisphaera galaxeae]
MKKVLCLFGIVFLLGSCEEELGNYYFEFDTVDWYTIDIDEGDVFALEDQLNTLENERLKLDLLINDIPNSVTDTTFIAKLETVGFTKTTINDSQKINTLREIFREKPHEDVLAAACIAVYRDILIFRKQGKIIGTSKVCFDCNQSQIHGTEVNTSYFGQSGDYGKLARLLHE